MKKITGLQKHLNKILALLEKMEKIIKRMEKNWR